MVLTEQRVSKIYLKTSTTKKLFKILTFMIKFCIETLEVYDLRSRQAESTRFHQITAVKQR